MRKQEEVQGIKLIYPAEEQQDAELVKEALEKVVPVLNQQYGLETPADCRVILMTGWRSFLDEAVPDWWKSFLWLVVMLQGRRFESTWEVAGGWHQRFGRRMVAGVKPRRLIEAANKRLGERIYAGFDSSDEKLISITCHELTHAFSDYLRLPSWLHEGLAMRATDHCLGKQTIQRETLDRLRESNTGRITRFNISDENTVLLLYIRGYWLTRWLEDEKPEILKEWLSQKKRPIVLEQELANALDLPLGTLWDHVDLLLYEHFTEDN